MLNIFLSLVSALILILAFPSNNFYFLAWVGLIPFFYAVISTKDIRKIIIYSFCFSMLFYGILGSWFTAFYKWANPLLINLGWFSFAFGESLYFLPVILFFKIFQQNMQFKNRYFLIIANILNLSFLWVLMDWVRSLGMLGNTVGQLAVSQYQFNSFIQLAQFGGAHGLTFILVFFNAGIAYFIYDLLNQRSKTPKKIFWIAYFIIIFGLLFLTNTLTKNILVKETAGGNTTREIGIYQPAVPQDQKLDISYYDNLKFRYIRDIRDFYQYHKVDLIVLPETIIPEFLLNNRMFMFSLTDVLESQIIFGVPRWKNRSLNTEYYNSVVLLSKSGDLKGYHDKKYIVPFGEYIPFRKQLYWMFQGTGFLESEYSPGNISSPMDEYACAICFESMLPYQLRQKVRNGGKLLIVSTNDAWFGRAALLEQHFAAGVLRAVENNRYLVQSGNTGISAIIDNRGRVIARSVIDKPQWVSGQVEMLHQKTIYTEFGELTIYAALVYLIFMIYIILVRLK